MGVTSGSGILLRLLDFGYSFGTIMSLKEKFEYSKVVISGRKSTKNREYNGQKNNKDNMTNINVQYTIKK
jgi:hypothetical protein